VTPTVIGTAIGAVLAIVGVAFGFWPLVLVAFAMAVGAVVGRIVEGRLDVGLLRDAFRGRRRSS
jgi:uncharacterized membrane protein